MGSLWEFPTIRGTLFGGPYNRDPTILGTLRSEGFRVSFLKLRGLRPFSGLGFRV